MYTLLLVTLIGLGLILDIKFSCPMINHDPEIAACPEFFALTPKDHWFKIPKGQICYRCLIRDLRECAKVGDVPKRKESLRSY